MNNKAAEKHNRKLRWILIIAIIVVAILVAVIAGVFGHRAYVEHQEEEYYANTMAKAERLVKSEKYDTAEELYLEMMDFRPERTEPYTELAQMYIDQERYVDAKALIKRGVAATGDKKAFSRMKQDIKILTDTGWKKAYINVLEDYEAEIRQYEEDVQASVAVCDVNEDRKPELFFFTKEYYGYGKLHIFTTIKDEPKEVDYECRNRGTQYQDAFYDVNSDDSSYAIFNSKEKDVFSIYANFIHGNSWDTINEFKLNKKGGCKQINVIEGSIDTTYFETDQDASKYLQNEEPITYEKYLEEFKRIMGDIDQVILYNGTGGDQSVWDKINADNVMCMSYDSMMVDLGAK